MKCPNCQHQSARVIIKISGSYCENCSDIKATGGANVNGILTRNAPRIQKQQAEHRADVVVPHKHDKTTGKTEVNPDFVKLYPEHTDKYYDEKQIKRSGDPKLKKLWDSQNTERQQHEKQLDSAEVKRKPRQVKKKKESLIKGL